jgi:hypothetical protein
MELSTPKSPQGGYPTQFLLKIGGGGMVKGGRDTSSLFFVNSLLLLSEKQQPSVEGP